LSFGTNKDDNNNSAVIVDNQLSAGPQVTGVSRLCFSHALSDDCWQITGASIHMLSSGLLQRYTVRNN